MPNCRHCGSPAVARFKTPQGCVCFPDDREQDLCMQHIVKDGTIGDGVEMIEDYRMQCPECGNRNITKSGFAEGWELTCRDCGARITAGTD